MNQGKLEVVTQEMATVNVNILGISELKWNVSTAISNDEDTAKLREGFAKAFDGFPKSYTADWL